MKKIIQALRGFGYRNRHCYEFLYIKKTVCCCTPMWNLQIDMIICAKYRMSECTLLNVEWLNCHLKTGQEQVAFRSQALGYTLWFSLFSLKFNIFHFGASILTFSMQNHLILKYFTNFDTTHFFYTSWYYSIVKMGCIKICYKKLQSNLL